MILQGVKHTTKDTVLEVLDEQGKVCTFLIFPLTLSGFGIEDVTGEDGEDYFCVELADSTNVRNLIKLGKVEIEDKQVTILKVSFASLFLPFLAQSQLVLTFIGCP